MYNMRGLDFVSEHDNMQFSQPYAGFTRLEERERPTLWSTASMLENAPGRFPAAVATVGGRAALGEFAIVGCSHASVGAFYATTLQANLLAKHCIQPLQPWRFPAAQILALVTILTNCHFPGTQPYMYRLHMEWCRVIR